jgi:hypothetical protein
MLKRMRRCRIYRPLLVAWIEATYHLRDVPKKQWHEDGGAGAVHGGLCRLVSFVTDAEAMHAELGFPSAAEMIPGEAGRD